MELVEFVAPRVEACEATDDGGLLIALELFSFGLVAAAEDDDVLAAVRKEIKKRQDSIEAFEKGGRPEQATKEKAEMKILEAYLPAAMSEADLEKLVKAVIAELGATDKKAMGAVMKACQTKAAGRADNRALSALVGKLLP